LGVGCTPDPDVRVLSWQPPDVAQVALAHQNGTHAPFLGDEFREV